ncbi:hypothetical protein A2291_04760 [candidate division WOR-1 bacterium RIFOXYB2_FULL_42_35]|uniref:Uncharacterized protein n=1 Tax=candidate division WOR-1 bacterium RIFOXYC2_FULL_41_25 TaxID=1802586 RepID=A0A1F4TNG5_UNCSA|nr:MAG: hypothetical protein A2247_06960 [candidate division WOR-1 bacterium RIFOXYA2_FULL_41_14]OGC24642.1 MAG: hypothetical protein A2291_04760 [candidate division WOR-1 bacterium RIFOXYB2_FULL_42_35]OGC34157.1 MAG: hypothetical protein A2462_08005 [candidate division WOR-1 bacterium RIFOXYC2_FULL_41_25]OGC42279.1 MAG: hypothetical protein A2548_04580 [candidate division WOR-1 bacterium RIFOXYD2_FULL_41_8]
MNIQHQQLAAGKWQKFTLCEQMANIGSEVERAIKWRNKGNVAYGQLAFERILELLDLSIGLQTTYPRLKELSRLREVLVDYFVFDNSYASSDSSWQKYFYAFNYAARVN